MLKRSFFVYLIFGLILLTVNIDTVHKQRGGYLWYLYQDAGKGKSIPAAVHYYDYLRRLDPADITIWKDLISTYVSAGQPEKAHETALAALKITPQDSKNYPVLLAIYKTLNEEFPLK